MGKQVIYGFINPVAATSSHPPIQQVISLEQLSFRDRMRHERGIGTMESVDGEVLEGVV